MRPARFLRSLAALAALSLSGAPENARAQDPDLDALQTTLSEASAELDVAWLGTLVDHGQYDAALDAQAEKPALAERLKQLAELQAELAAMERKRPSESERAAYAKRLAEIEESMDHRRLAIDLHLPRGAGAEDAIRRTTKITVEEVQRAIPADGALIEIVRYAPARGDAPSEMERWGAPRYAAFILKREGDPALTDLGEATAIEDLVKKIRQALSSPQIDVKDAARALDGAIMAKVRPHLGGARRLWIVPDGELHRIPFEALIDEAGHYLTTGYSVTYLGTGRDLVRQKASGPSLGPPAAAARQCGRSGLQC